MDKNGYQPHIDGLRAVAILPVVAYHADSILVPAGFLGVDVFFVISGYLITRLIWTEIQREQFSMLRFWERRARRLLPAALVMSLACWLLGSFLLLPGEFLRLSEEMLSHCTFVSNIYFWLNTDYFSPKSELRPLLNTWSLSVEEQFYLIVAPLLIFIWGRWRVRGAEATIWFITGASLISAIAWRHIDPDATFYLLPFRAWELGFGAILAIRQPVLAGHVATFVAVAALAILIVAYFYFPSARSPGKGTFLATFATAALLASTEARTPVTRALSVAPLVWIGLISYSLYLWHWPALSFLNILKGDLRTPTDTMIALVIALMSATASYYLIESPIRRRRVLAGRVAMLAVSSAIGAATAAVALTTFAAHGFESRWAVGALEIVESAKTRDTRFYECSERTLDDVHSNGFCRLGLGAGNTHGRVIVLGDSHGSAMMPLFDRWADANHILGWQLARPRCKPLEYAAGSKSCIAFNKFAIEFVKAIKPSDVVLVGRWEQASNNESYQVQLADNIRELSNSGARVWLVRQVPNPGIVVPENLARAFQFDWKPLQLRTQRYLSTTRALEDQVIRESLPYLTDILDPTPLFCDKQECRLEIDGLPAYSDDNHLSAAGAIALMEMLSPITGAILAGADRVIGKARF